MPLVVPNVAEERILELFLNQGLVLKLYSNDIIPAEDNTSGTFIEVAGAGYASKALSFNEWAITPGDPTVGLFAEQTFAFTGVTSGPGTIYGYYVVASDGVLMWAERFAAAVVPFSPVNGSQIIITPRFEAS